MSRPNWTQYLMRMAYTAAERSTCRKTVDGTGCIIADTDHRVLASGYNGSMPRAPHCEDVGHLLLDGHCIRTVHAESNAIADAARRGIAVNSAVAYCILQPCKDCLKLMAAAGIFKVVFSELYVGEHNQASAPEYFQLMKDSRIFFEHMPRKVIFHEGPVKLETVDGPSMIDTSWMHGKILQWRMQEVLCDADSKDVE